MVHRRLYVCCVCACERALRLVYYICEHTCIVYGLPLWMHSRCEMPRVRWKLFGWEFSKPILTRAHARLHSHSHSTETTILLNWFVRFFCVLWHFEFVLSMCVRAPSQQNLILYIAQHVPVVKCSAISQTHLKHRTLNGSNQSEYERKNIDRMEIYMYIKKQKYCRDEKKKRKEQRRYKIHWHNHLLYQRYKYEMVNQQRWEWCKKERTNELTNKEQNRQKREKYVKKEQSQEPKSL